MLIALTKKNIIVFDNKDIMYSFALLHSFGQMRNLLPFIAFPSQNPNAEEQISSGIIWWVANGITLV